MPVLPKPAAPPVPGSPAVEVAGVPAGTMTGAVICVPGQRDASALAANRDRRVTALLLAGRRGAGQRVRFVKPIAVSSAEPGGTPATVHPRPPHRRSRPRSKGRNVPGSAQCGVASALCAVLLLLLLVFILENSQRADTSDFGAHGHLPPGVALLLAGVLGNAARRDRSARAQDAAAERGAEIARSDPKRGAVQSRWCRRQNPLIQASCG